MSSPEPEVPHPSPPAGSPLASTLVFTPAESEGLAQLKTRLPAILAASLKPAAAGEASGEQPKQEQEQEQGGASAPAAGDDAEKPAEPVAIWGVPLAADSTDPRVDVILVKFLRARENNVDNAAAMLEATLRWRREFKIDELLSETFPDFFGGVGYIHKTDATGHPVVYNVYGGLDNAEVFGNLERFIRWRVQLMERAVRLLDFTTIDSITNIHDYAGISFFSMDKHSKAASKAVIQVMADNYPEVLYKKFFINMPWFFASIFKFFRSMVSDRTQEKFNLLSDDYRPILLATIGAENLPALYGGLSDTQAHSKLQRKSVGNLGEIKTVEIPARSSHVEEISVLAESGAVVVWEVTLGSHDIRFKVDWVTKVDSKEESAVVHAEEKIFTTTVGSYTAAGIGSVRLTFDNTFSIFTPKTVIFRLGVMDNLAESK